MLSALLGDYNGNGVVDAPDYVVWRNTLGQSPPGLAADGNGSGTIDQGDYNVWRAHFGQTAGSGAGAGAGANGLQFLNRQRWCCFSSAWWRFVQVST